MRPRMLASAVAGCVVLAGRLYSQAQQPAPTFLAGVDVVQLDAEVSPPVLPILPLAQVSTAESVETSGASVWRPRLTTAEGRLAACS